MEISTLREFVSLSRTMNFTKTAREEHLSQSALSNHIAKMEQELGVELIDRSGRKPRLTVAGFEFLETASHIINTFDQYIERKRNNNFSAQNHMVVQVLQHADRATSVILSRIKQFKTMHPEARFEIREALTYDTIDNMENGLADCGYLALGFNEPNLPDGIITIPILDEEVVVWLDSSKPEAHAKELSPKGLESFEFPTWVGLGTPNQLDDMTTEICAQFDVKVRYAPRYCISLEDYYLNKISSNDAIMFTEGSNAIHSIRIREDRIIRPFNPPIYVHTYMAFRKTDLDVPLRKEFVDFLTVRYSADPRADDVERWSPSADI